VDTDEKNQNQKDKTMNLIQLNAQKENTMNSTELNTTDTKEYQVKNLNTTDTKEYQMNNLNLNSATMENDMNNSSQLNNITVENDMNNSNSTIAKENDMNNSNSTIAKENNVNNSSHAINIAQSNNNCQDIFEQFKKKVFTDFTTGSGIDPALFESAVEFHRECEWTDGMDALYPIHETLGWKKTRFTHNISKNELLGAFLKNEDGTVWQVIVNIPSKHREYSYFAPKGIGDKPYLPPVPKSIREKINKLCGKFLLLIFWQRKSPKNTEIFLHSTMPACVGCATRRTPQVFGLWRLISSLPVR
jgi:hypothetical protein